MASPSQGPSAKGRLPRDARRAETHRQRAGRHRGRRTRRAEPCRGSLWGMQPAPRPRSPLGRAVRVVSARSCRTSSHGTSIRFSTETASEEEAVYPHGSDVLTDPTESALAMFDLRRLTAEEPPHEPNLRDVLRDHRSG